MKLVDLSAYNRHDGPFFFAVEELLAKSMNDDEEYFFTWMMTPCVIIGRNQVLQNEVNETFMADHGYPVWRRPSGGGAVYADLNCVMFSFVTSHYNNQMVFDTYLGKVVSVFRKMGLNAEFTGRNDLLVDGLKFSGNSFYRYKNHVVLHGTILFDVDIENLVKAITPSDEKLISKGIASVRQRVTNIRDRLSVDKPGMIDFMSHHLCDETMTLTPAQISEVHRLEKRYAAKDWIYGKNPPFTLIRKKKYPAGNIELRLDIKDGKIHGVQWCGDYFTLQSLDELTTLLIEKPYDKTLLNDVLKNIDVSQFIFRFTNEELLDLLF